MSIVGTGAKDDLAPDAILALWPRSHTDRFSQLSGHVVARSRGGDICVGVRTDAQVSNQNGTNSTVFRNKSA